MKTKRLRSSQGLWDSGRHRLPRRLEHSPSQHHRTAFDLRWEPIALIQGALFQAGWPSGQFQFDAGSLDDKTVIRTAYGIIYPQATADNSGNFPTIQGFNPTTQGVLRPDGITLQNRPDRGFSTE